MQKLITLLTLQIFICTTSIFAQSRSIALNNFSTGSCSNNLYSITFSNCAGAHIKIVPQITFNGTPNCLGTTQGVYMLFDSVTPTANFTLINQSAFLKFSIATNDTFTVYYQPLIDCHILGNNSASITQTFTDTTNAYSFSVNGGGSNFIANISRPNIQLISSGAQGAAYLSQSHFNFLYQNSSLFNSANIEFTFTPDPTNYCGIVDTGAITFQNGLNGGPVNYSATSPNTIILNPTDTLIIRQEVFIDSCIVSGSCSQKQATLNWSCNNSAIPANSFCTQCGSTIPYIYDVNNNDVADVDVIRFSPADSSIELSCMNDTSNATLWSYAIINTGVGAIDTLYFDLLQAAINTNSLQGLSLINIESLNYHTNANAQCTVDTTTFLRTNWLCQDLVDSALHRCNFRIKNFGENDTLFVSFRTMRCSAENDTLINVPKAYNRWLFSNFNARTVCGDVVPQTGNGFYAGGTTISGQGAGGGGYDLDLKLNYYPTFNALSVNNGVGDQHTFSMDLKGLTSNGTHVKQLLGCTTPNNTCSNLFGWMRVTLFCDSNLKVKSLYEDVKLIKPYNNNNDTIFYLPDYYYTVIDTVDTTNCTPGNYYYYFNLNDSGMTAALDSGQLLFTLTACCGSDLAVSPYNVTYHLLANPNNCFTLDTTRNHTIPPPITNTANNGIARWLTLSRRGNIVNILCPGCLSPALIAEKYSMRRVSLGLQDTDNDGRADSANAQINVNSAWYAQNKNNLRTGFSGYGDKIEDKMSGYFVDGDRSGGLGYDYKHLTDLGLRFNVIQLSRIAPNALSVMNATPDSIIFYIDDTTNSVNGCIDCADFQKDPNGFTTQLVLVATGANINNGIFEANYTNDEYRFYFTSFFDSVANSYSGNLHDTVNYVTFNSTVKPFTGFFPYQYYRMRVVYNVCGNFTAEGNTLDDVIRESDILNRLFLNAEIKREFSDNIPQMPNGIAGLHADSLTVDISEVPPYTLVDTSFMQDYAFYCEATSGIHYFVSNNVVNATNISNDKGCIKSIRINASSKIAGGTTVFDAYPFEYKPPTLLPDSVSIQIPTGYYAANATISNNLRYGTVSTLTNRVPFTLIDTVGIIGIKYNTMPQLVCFPQSTNANSTDTLFAIDQFNERYIDIQLIPIDCPDTITPHPNSSIMAFNVQSLPCFNQAAVCNSSASVIDTSISGITNYNKLGNDPIVTISSIQNRNVELNSDTVCFNNIIIQNQNTGQAVGLRYDANNVFIALPSPPSAYLSNWFAVVGNNPPIIANNNILGITTNLQFGTNISVNLCAKVNNCPVISDTIDFPIHYGWNCDSFPASPYNSNSVCGFKTDTLKFYRATSLFSTEGKTVLPEQYVLCDTITVSGNFTSEQAGAIYPDSVILHNLPIGLDVVNATVLGFLGTASLNPSTNDSLWFVTPAMMNAIGYTGGTYSNGSTINFSFDMIATCAYAGNDILPDIQVFSHSFCNEPLTANAAFIMGGSFAWSDSSICDDCFTVTKTANTDSLAAVTDTVTYTITVCNYSDTTYNYSVADSLPPNFTPSPFSTQTLTLAPSQCDSILISGTFSQTANCPANMNVAIVTNQNTNTVQQDSVCVTVTEPCITPTTIRLLNNTTSTALLSAYGSQQFYVDGLFTVNDTLFLNDCQVYTAPGAQIIVTDSGYLYLDEYTIIQGCINMWRGIVAKPKSDIIVTMYSTIADADTGIYVERQARVDVIASSLINNYKGMALQKIGNSAFHQGTLKIEGSTFGMYAANFKPSYPGQGSRGLLPWCGIELNDWNGGAIGSPYTTPNTFFNMQRGIYGDRSDFISVGNYFENIRLDTSLASKPTSAGFAITSQGAVNQRAGNLIVYPVTGFTMLNCFGGVYTNYSSLSATNISMRVTSTGFLTTQCKNNLFTNVYFNTIETNFRGIYYYLNVGAQYMKANENAITVQNNANGIGIAFFESTAGYGNYEAKYNGITLIDGFTGIHSNGVFKAVINDNNIQHYYSSGSIETRGISVTGGDSVTLSCNTMTTDYPQTIVKVYGTYFSGSKYYNISCNTSNNHYYGNYFMLDCSFSDSSFKGNNMNSHRTGLYLYGSAKIGIQNWRGNLWNNNNPTTFGAFNQNSSSGGLLASRFIVNNTSTELPTTPTSNLGWFNIQAGSIYSCGFNCNSSLAMQGNNNNNSYEISVALDAVTTSEFVDEGKAIAKQNLYEILSVDTVLRNSDVILSDFYSNNDNTTIGKLFDAEINIKQATQLSPQALYLVALADSLISTKKDSLTLLDSLNFIAPVSNFDALKNAVYNTILTLEQTRNTLLAQENSIANSKLNSATQINSSIVPNEIPQQNDKFANQINVLYQKYGLDTLATYFYDMLSIAQQCPSMGGTSVYTMRGFVELFDATIVHDDDATCLQYGLYRKAIESSKDNIEVTAIIIPNPANESITISLNQFSSGICKIEVSDCLGITQIEKELDCKTSSLLINTSTLQQGLYFVKVILNDSLISKTKLIIAR